MNTLEKLLTEEFWARMEQLARAMRDLPDGRTLCAYPLFYGRGRLLVSKASEPTEVVDVWEFPTFLLAVEVVGHWDGTNEPPGWDRHPASHRKRLHGREALEYLDGDSPPPQCPQCKGELDRSCLTCNGNGHIPIPLTGVHHA